MSSGLIKSQQSIYEAVWSMPEYREKCHSLDLWQNHPEIFPESFDSALDIGCGLGLLMGQWNDQGIDAWGIDHVFYCLDTDVMKKWGHKFHQSSLWEMNLHRRFHLGICTDVMEHIPEEFVPLTLNCIAAYCGVVIFKIANFQSNFLGFDLHPTRKPAEWWQEQICAIGGSVEQLDIPTAREEHYFRWYT